MTISEFQALSILDQMEILKKHGLFVSERWVDCDRYYLYVINYFYVEVAHKLSNPMARGLHVDRVFTERDLLDKYMDPNSN